jgi:SAM-dependent methyltransferase
MSGPAKTIVRRAGKRVIGAVTHAVGRFAGSYYFEDFVRVYPDGLAYNRLGLRRRARDFDLDNFRNHLKFYEFAAQFVGGKRVADIGCGSGYGCKVLREAGASAVYGADISKHALRFAGKHFGSYAEFSRQGITDLAAYPDGFVDVVVSSEVLEHIKEYGFEDRALAELERIARPGGLLVVGTPNAELLGNHGFSYDELRELFERRFDDFLIFENALLPVEPKARASWAERRASGAVGTIVSERIETSYATLPEVVEVKRGLEPGVLHLGEYPVDTRLLHNTHSWVVLGVRPDGRGDG